LTLLTICTDKSFEFLKIQDGGRTPSSESENCHISGVTQNLAC